MKVTMQMILIVVFYLMLTSSMQSAEEEVKKNNVTFLVVKKTGGIAGIEEKYSVTVDGKVSFSNRTKKSVSKLSRKEYVKFDNSVHAVDWEKLPEKKYSKGADFFKYDVTVRIKGKIYHRLFDGQIYSMNKAMMTFLTEINKLK